MLHAAATKTSLQEQFVGKSRKEESVEEYRRTSLLTCCYTIVGYILLVYAGCFSLLGVHITCVVCQKREV